MRRVVRLGMAWVCLLAALAVGSGCRAPVATTLRVPTKLAQGRDVDGLVSTNVDHASMVDVTITRHPDASFTGVTGVVFTHAAGQPRGVSSHLGQAEGLEFNLGTMLDVRPGSVIELDLEAFETDVRPSGRSWDPRGPRYRALWKGTITAIAE